MLLIYTHKITPRLTYTMRQLFTRILGVEITFTTKVEDFIKHSGAKITYTKQALQNEFFVRSNDLLFEQGINDFQITVRDWNGVPCFFSAGERSNIPFDIFSASFYLLSRYEEYLPHVKDVHGRFPPKESLAHMNNFLRQPVVDIWAYRLREMLLEKFPDLEYTSREYKYTSLIDVTTSHSYAYRGLVRSVAGLFYDLGTLKLRRVVDRVKVWFDPQSDPYDNFEYLVDLHKKLQLKSIFFFQFAAYSTYDKNVSPNHNKFRYLIKSISDYSTVALAASYSSFTNVELLKKERKDLAGVINRSVDASRMRYNRIQLPQSYRDLIEAEFTDDYTMGYTHELGFRAGTCSTFYFYDINLEIQQPIRVHPFAVHDYALNNFKNKEAMLEGVNGIYQQIQNVEGEFLSIFSNELLGGKVNRVDWKDFYAQFIKRFHV
ncbi:polysaccharide deacetylase family protein [Cytophaga sp. FL35]|uniref:polysaccharide deacetylase family protein n=1 Tax=Cytophaga sp. FL35 TaxID=1904456 RepID=UPI0016535353|nr:polysaccharide deacetylase family protein [Cytophaga sp. FL35]MBC6999743.1 polysaccharide deacetylase family protein [Cytophaga sp. FL35]